jgi:hypothetical protein
MWGDKQNITKLGKERYKVNILSTNLKFPNFNMEVKFELQRTKMLEKFKEKINF